MRRFLNADNFKTRQWNAHPNGNILENFLFDPLTLNPFKKIKNPDHLGVLFKIKTL